MSYIIILATWLYTRFAHFYINRLQNFINLFFNLLIPCKFANELSINYAAGCVTQRQDGGGKEKFAFKCVFKTVLPLNVMDSEGRNNERQIIPPPHSVGSRKVHTNGHRNTGVQIKNSVQSLMNEDTRERRKNFSITKKENKTKIKSNDDDSKSIFKIEAHTNSNRWMSE